MSSTQQRRVFSDDESLISATTPNSHITYVNDVFCKVSGYDPEDLLGQPHNIIRHPEMPKAAFGQLWSYIRSGKSWMGLVKNRCKESGYYYWVSALVTPIMGEDGKVYEYQSVRSQPTDEQIARAEGLYRKLKQKDVAPKRMSWMRLMGVAGLAQLIVLALALTNAMPSTWTFAALIPMVLVQLGALTRLNSRLSTVNKQAKQSYENALMEQPYTGYFDDLSAIELAMSMRKAELRAATARANETAQQLRTLANEEVSNCQAIDQELAAQEIATDAMAVSAEEMNASISDVSMQAQQSSEFASNAQFKAQDGVSTIEEAVETVRSLSQHLGSSKVALEKLFADVDSIETILEMIQGIAEQTNLLALNAAIEAARAGAHGRGFAVVADEVRALSGKTASSVDEIRSKIEVLQSTVRETGELVQEGIASSEESVTKSLESRDSFEAIVSDLISIGEQSAQTSNAISEQVIVTQGMAENVVQMREAIGETKTLSGTSLERTADIVKDLDSLQRLVRQFS